MAIRKLPSGSFQAYWNNPFTGKRESMAFPTKEEAQKKDALVKFQLQYERDLFRPDPAYSTPRPDTLEEVFKAYLTDRIHTKKGVIWQLDSMKSALLLFGDTPIAEIRTEGIAKIIQSEQLKGVKNATVRNRMRVLKTLFSWAVKKGILDIAPQFPEMPPLHYEKFVPPSREEISIMLENATEHIRRVIILGCQTGMRVGPCELFRLQWQHIDIAQRVIRVQAARKNPNEPWREIPIRDELVPVLTVWKKQDMAEGVSYVIHYKSKPVMSIKDAWAAMLKRAGITRRIRPYDLRHSFATEMLAAGVDIGTTASLMGHSDPSMLLKYYQHVMTEQKKAAVQALPYVHEGMCMTAIPEQ